jgi:hypothetical protein
MILWQKAMGGKRMFRIEEIEKWLETQKEKATVK